MTNQTYVLLEKLVSIESVFPRELEIIDFIEDFVHQLGVTSRRVQAAKNRDNLVVTLGDASSNLCLYGHVDTVPPASSWKNPYKVTYKGDVAQGLGVTDMKGGVAVILSSLVYAKEKGLPLKAAFGVDEENISLGSYALTKDNFFDDVAFIISAESGQVRDTNLDFAVNLGRKGRVAFDCYLQGKSAHAARADLAINPIEKVADFIQLLRQIHFEEHEHLGKIEIVPFDLQSHTDSFSIPESAQLRINVLTVPGVSSQQVLRKIKTLARKQRIPLSIKYQLRETPFMEAYEIEQKNSFYQLMTKNVFSHYSLNPGYAQSVADENRFAHKLQVPVISIGPIGGGDHTSKEWVSLESLRMLEESYQDIVQLWNQFVS